MNKIPSPADPSALFSPADLGAAPGSPPQPSAAPPRPPRLRSPQRDQGEMFCESLDQRIDLDHAVRIVWAFVEQLDLSPLLQSIKAVQGHPGRDPIDPRIPLALWLFAASEGVGSARQLERLCLDHRAFQWLCGGVSVNYHSLADFRVNHVDLLDRLLAQSLASLTHQGLIDVNTIAQDGMRIRASAGSDSFRREATLQEHLQQATAHLEKLKAETELNPQQLNARRQAAQLRAAREKQERLQQALVNVEQIAASREERKKGDGVKARASSTDPEARRTNMPDGGTRPAYNAQFATDVDTGIIVGVQASNAVNDAREFEPMMEDIKCNVGKHPEQALLDGSYSTKHNVELSAELGIDLLAPLKDVQKQLDAGKDPHAPKRGDSAAMKAFRARMGEAEAKERYRLRGQTAEWTNAQARNANLYQVRVRGKAKVQAVLLLFALAHNLLRAEKLREKRKG